MRRHRSHSVEFKRQVAQEFLGGEALHGLAKRHDVSPNLIRIWVEKYEAGVLDEDAQAIDWFRNIKCALQRSSQQRQGRCRWPCDCFDHDRADSRHAPGDAKRKRRHLDGADG
jgi:transposase-like protein